MRSYFVYVIECVANEKLYIGISYDPRKRWQRHLSSAKAKKYNTPLYNSINKYGPAKFRFSTFENYATLAEANCAERYWIAYLKSMGLTLLNITEGGDGTLGTPMSEENKKKQSERNKGEKNFFYGKKFSGAANGHFGHKMKSEVQAELLKHRTKLPDDKLEELKKKFATRQHSQTALAKEFGISLTQVHRIVHGKRRKGADNDNSLLTKPNLTMDDAIEIRRLYATDEYTQKQIAKQYNLSSAQVSRIIRGLRW